MVGSTGLEPSDPQLVEPDLVDDLGGQRVDHEPTLPSPIYSTYAFATKLEDANRELPKVHLMAKNRLTQYMGPASAYAAVLRSISNDVRGLLGSNPDMFTFAKVNNGLVDIRDFQTTGVVAFARGCPFYDLPSGRLDVMGQRVQVKEDYRRNCVEAMEELVGNL
jgi:hypothetical protein